MHAYIHDYACICRCINFREAVLHFYVSSFSRIESVVRCGGNSLHRWPLVLPQLSINWSGQTFTDQNFVIFSVCDQKKLFLCGDLTMELCVLPPLPHSLCALCRASLAVTTHGKLCCTNSYTATDTEVQENPMASLLLCLQFPLTNFILHS